MPEKYIEALRAFIEATQTNGNTSLGERITSLYCVKLVAANVLKPSEDEAHVGYAGGIIVSADTDMDVFEAITFLVVNGLHDVCHTTFFEVVDLGELGDARSASMPFAKLFAVRLTTSTGTSDMTPS